MVYTFEAPRAGIWMYHCGTMPMTAHIANGMAGAVYKQAVPLANPMTRPGTWNTYDIFYTAPRFRKNGSVETPAFVTVVMNGVLVLHHFQIHGTIQYIGTPRYELHGRAPLMLQGHGSPVSFRNIWIREL